MKKIIKRISCIMAAVMVSSIVFCGTGSEAACKITLKSGAAAPSTIYTGHSYSLKVSGVAVKFYSSNKKVAKVGATTGKLKALAKGTVKITAKNKKTGKAVASKTFKVLQRCQSVSVDEKEVYLDPNDTTVLKAKLTPESSTDIIRFYSSDKNVATVGATSGKLKAVREGKTTIMVYAKATKATSNSSKSNRIAKVNVYVGPHMYKVSQISTTEVKVFFKKDVEKYKLRASDFSIINNVTKASCSIKEISVNGNKVNLTTYNEIKDDNEYTVSCKNTSARFVATDGRVSSITIDTTEIEAKKETPLDLTLKDASGILLKKCSTDNMPAEMELTGTVDNGYISGGKVCITKPGSTAKVKVIYHTQTSHLKKCLYTLKIQ